MLSAGHVSFALPGRFLSEPGGLVFDERVGCGVGVLRVPVECEYESGEAVV